MKFLEKFNYLFALNVPLFAGFIISLNGSEYAVAFAWSGWLIYIILSVFLKAFFKINADRSNSQVLFTTVSLLLPLVLLVISDGYLGISKYFIVGCTFEAIGLYGALVLMVLFGTGVDGKRSFQSLGVGFVLIFLIIVSAFVLPYVLINIDFYYYTKLNSYDAILALTGLFLLGFNWIKDIVQLRNLSMKGLFKEDDENPLKTVGMIVLWMLGLNLTYVFATL